MNYYLNVFREYTNFETRTSRKDYWMFFLINLIISIAIQTLPLPRFIPSIYTLVLMIPSMAIATRRLHDVNKSGWMQLLWFFIIIGWIWLFVLLAKKGDEGENDYGVDPLNPVDELNEIGTQEI